jgi:RasGEF family protein
MTSLLDALHPAAMPKAPRAAVRRKTRKPDDPGFEFEKVDDMWEIASARADDLINKLTDNSYCSDNFADDFMISYLYFTSTKVILQRLTAEYFYRPRGAGGWSKARDLVYHRKKADWVRRRVVFLLGRLVEHHGEEFVEDQSLTDYLLGFIDRVLARTENDHNLERDLLFLARLLVHGDPLGRWTPRDSHPILTHAYARLGQGFSIDAVAPRELAEQLTILDHQTLLKVRGSTLWIDN